MDLIHINNTEGNHKIYIVNVSKITCKYSKGLLWRPFKELENISPIALCSLFNLDRWEAG